MRFFKNIFITIHPSNTTYIDFDKLVEVRRAKLQQLGYETGAINWEHYKKVLKAKYEKLKNS
jgi:hypothetical protein